MSSFFSFENFNHQNSEFSGILFSERLQKYLERIWVKTIVRCNCLLPEKQDFHSTTGNYPSGQNIPCKFWISSQYNYNWWTHRSFAELIYELGDLPIHRNILFMFRNPRQILSCLINRGSVLPNICSISNCWQQTFFAKYTARENIYFCYVQTFTSQNVQS